MEENETPTQQCGCLSSRQTSSLNIAHEQVAHLHHMVVQFRFWHQHHNFNLNLNITSSST
eukprot:scaffold33640_cov139-Skeletonema_marinoi.AAC.1